MMILVVVVKRLVIGIWKWLSEDDNKDNVPRPPPIDKSQFETENEGTKKDNYEAGTVEMDEENRCGDSIDEALEGSKFTSAVTHAGGTMALGSTNLMNQFSCMLE